MSTPQHEKIRVYVGTYGKYAAGSIAGGWLTLNNYKTPEDFWEACRRLHRNEPDPEFMFQDYEVPDFLGGCITEGHIDTKEIWAYMNAPVQAEETPVSNEYSKEQLKAWKAEFIEAHLATDSWHASVKDKQAHDDYWRPYYEKKWLTAIRCGDAFFPVEKLSIKTSFCFGAGSNGLSTDEDWDDAFAAQDSIHKFDNWLAANTEDTEKDIAGLEAGRHEDGYLPFICRYGVEVKLLWRRCAYSEMPEGSREPSAEERAIILAGLRLQLADITKRCKAYWKRYGASKLHTWTYLRD